MPQRYHHPLEIPRSRLLRSIDWLGDRIRIRDPYGWGDTHPMTWAADDEIYVGTGDPMCLHDDNGERIPHYEYPRRHPEMPPEEAKRFAFAKSTGTCVEKLSGGPETMILSRVHDMPFLIGCGGSGSKPTGMISVDGVLYLAVQNLLGWKPAHYGIMVRIASTVRTSAFSAPEIWAAPGSLI